MPEDSRCYLMDTTCRLSALKASQEPQPCFTGYSEAHAAESRGVCFILNDGLPRQQANLGRNLTPGNSQPGAELTPTHAQANYCTCAPAPGRSEARKPSEMTSGNDP